MICSSVQTLNKRISKTVGCYPNKCLYKKGCKLISLIVLMLTPKLCKKRVMVLVHIEIYLPMKFQVDTSYSFFAMLCWTI